MKFYKLVKSIDYVTYPSYIELRKINKTIGDSISNLQNIVLSALVAFIFDTTFISKWIVKNIFANAKNKWLVSFANNNNASTIIAIYIAIIVFLGLWGYRFINNRWGSNKDTVDERDELVFTFYKVIIPHLISLKSVIQQHDEADDWDKDKRYLLILQAKHEVCELIKTFNGINVTEINSKTGELTDDAKSVLEQIGSDVYFTVLLDLLTNAKGVINRVYECKDKEITKTLESLIAVVGSAKAFNECKKLTSIYYACKKIQKVQAEIININA